LKWVSLFLKLHSSLSVVSVVPAMFLAIIALL